MIFHKFLQRTLYSFLFLALLFGQSLRSLAADDEDFQRFCSGVLIYNQGKSDEVRLKISDLANPLEGTFGLSRCGETKKYLSIATGYRKEMMPTNSNKVEVWIVPKFIVERDLSTTARHLAPIMDKFTSPVGIFWTWGGWDNSSEKMGWYDYLTVQNFDDLSNGENLYEKWTKSERTVGGDRRILRKGPTHDAIRGFSFNFN